MQQGLLLVILLSLFTIKCEAKTIHIRLTSAPKSLDWNIATSGSESAIIQNLMESLFTALPNGEVKPSLAKEITWSPDQKKLTLEIKKGVTWLDGKELESQHFLDSFERLLNPKLNSENAALLFDLIGARDYFLGKLKSFNEVGIKSQGKYTLIFSLNEARVNFLQILTHWATAPIRKEQLKMTLGPYQLRSFQKDKIILSARDPLAEIKTAVFEVIENGSEALKKFREKKIDYLLQLEDPLLEIENLKSLPPLAFVNPTRVVALLHFNPLKVPTNSSEKRRAIMAAISTQALVAAHPRSRILAKNMIPPGLPGGPSLDQHPEAFEPGQPQGPLPAESLTLAYPNDSLSRSIAEQIQADTKQLKIIIEALPSEEWSQASKKYDLVLTLFGLDYYDPDQLFSSFLSQGTHDLFNTNSLELLSILKTARATESINKRAKLYADASQYLQNKTALVMPLFYRRRACLLQANYTFDAGYPGTYRLSQIHPKK